ncbi:hypothetical protein ID854_15255 [Xenorhabdus sp. M]|uniref:Uncharacterized protein n=1 Tax=Xenorhabdus szentirmaii TaxID=290112 RepID=A0AAW3YY66_9GAMM|nr:hypothetical protein [Xenorhabdus sp. M]MBD2801764.1 hypothetical protein [Xenorhabdus sp. M]
MGSSIKVDFQRMESYENLYKNNYLSHHELLSQKDKISRLKHQREISQNKYMELRHKINEVEREREINTQMILKESMEMKRNANNDIERLLIEINKTKKEPKQLYYIAP